MVRKIYPTISCMKRGERRTLLQSVIMLVLCLSGCGKTDVDDNTQDEKGTDGMLTEALDAGQAMKKKDQVLAVPCEIRLPVM